MGVFEETAKTLESERPEAYCGTCDRSFPVDTLTCPDDGTKLVRFKAKTDTMIGRMLDDRYRIETQLGQGGMGAVYRGRQLSIDREVAIKVVHPAIAADRDAAKRFLREARLASSLSAPGIVAVYDFGQTEDGVLYLVMELIDGRSLADLMKNRVPLEPARVAGIGLQLCDALDVAHSAGVIHRDLKPGNMVMFDTPTGEVIKVLDFGIAKAADVPSITSTQGMVGTPVYMAPEQFEGRSDVRSDLYSLGCVLYELASGSQPFIAGDLNTLLTKHLTETPAPLPANVPGKLTRAIMRLLEKDPKDRFASAGDLRTALRGIGAAGFGSGPIIRTSMMALPEPFGPTGQSDVPTAAAAEVEPTTPPPVRRSRTMILLASIVGSAALGVVAFSLIRSPHSKPADAPAAASAAPVDAAIAPVIAAPAPPVIVDADVAAVVPVDAAVAPAAVVKTTPQKKKPVTQTKKVVHLPDPKKPEPKKPEPKKPDDPKKPDEVQLPFVKAH